LKKHIPIATTKRLPLYHEYVSRMESEGSKWVSSFMIANALGLTPSTIRQDLKHLEAIESSSFGYSTKSLKKVLENALGVTTGANMVLVGVGRLGQAIVHHKMFKEKGFVIKALFDAKEDLIGKRICNIPIYPLGRLPEIVKKKRISIGIVTTPVESAQYVTDLLVDANIKGIWNFAPINLRVPPNVAIENVNLCPSLFLLAFRIKLLEKLP